MTKLNDDHRADLIENHAITPEVLEAAGIESGTMGTGHPWRDGVTEVWQERFDDEHRKAGANRYHWPPEKPLILNRLREPTGDAPVILAEGTCQHLAVASWTEPKIGVYGMQSCWGWTNADLSWAAGRHVIALFDADMTTNRDVWNAADGLREALEAEGAASIRFVKLPARDKDGIDDVLARRAPETRAAFLARLIDKASDKLPKQPSARSQTSPDKIAAKVLKVEHMALTRERTVAVYRDGVFRTDPEAFNAIMTDILKDDFSRGLRDNVHEYIKGLLYNEGRFLPERQAGPLLTVANGVLDLRTGELKPWSPDYLSTVKIPIPWEPDATCPTYETWIKDMAGDQVDDLEEVTSTMLDPSRTPIKAAFLFGPSRSGKGTYHRIMRAVAGAENVSAVTLHQLSDDRFAAANVYGKILNSANDLSAKHVNDLSIFKMLTGEDEINANRKYGHQFTFTNRALFAFSANEIPTVSESSRAYAERMKPFKFGNSFAGREDDSIEQRIMSELPGILVRWVRAWQRMRERGRFLETASNVREEFEMGSDRVSQFIADCCLKTASPGRETASPNEYLPQDLVSTRQEIARAFDRWAEINNGPKMSRKTLINKLTSINGIVEVRIKDVPRRGQRGFNIMILPESQWGEAKEAVSLTNSPDVAFSGVDHALEEGVGSVRGKQPLQPHPPVCPDKPSPNGHDPAPPSNAPALCPCGCGEPHRDTLNRPGHNPKRS